jgi:hypothetical protein
MLNMDIPMGQLKPGATYIYESPDGGETTYAREAGTNERILVGQTYKQRSKLDQILEDKLWGEIRRKAQTHEGLREELERVIIFYKLLEEQEPYTPMYHPV